MSAREPLSAAELERIADAAQWLTIAWGQRKPDLQSAHEVAAEWGARIAREDVPALLAEVARLTSAPAQIRAQAERVVRQQQGRGATTAEIVQALVDAALLKTAVRPGVEPLPEGGAR